MSSTRLVCALTWLAWTGCGETRILQGTSEGAATEDSPPVAAPSTDLSTEPAVSLIEQYESGAPPAAGMGGMPSIDSEPTRDAGVSVADAEVAGPALQMERCDIDMSCDFKCTSVACAITCDEANKCKVDCGEDSSTCQVSCRGANNCEPKCRSGSCEFDCTEANNCDHLRCEEGAACLARCTGASNCKWEDCDDPRPCPGDIIVCNRECPG
jgi:hypothetical protein